MKDHQQRVVDESIELSERLDRLDEFLENTPSGIALEPEERADMQQQSDVMATYARILGRRIGRF